jgi:hypothetical protein
MSFHKLEAYSKNTFDVTENPDTSLPWSPKEAHSKNNRMPTLPTADGDATVRNNKIVKFRAKYRPFTPNLTLPESPAAHNRLSTSVSQSNAHALRSRTPGERYLQLNSKKRYFMGSAQPHSHRKKTDPESFEGTTPQKKTSSNPNSL